MVHSRCLFLFIFSESNAYFIYIWERAYNVPTQSILIGINK